MHKFAPGTGKRPDVFTRVFRQFAKFLMRRSFFLVVWLIFGLMIGSTFNVAAGQSKPPIKVGSKKFTENVILARMIEQVIETVERDGQDFSAEHVELGGTQVLWNALLAGEIDMYVDYTGTISHEILAEENVETLEQIREALGRKGVRMLAPFGFNNTYAIGMLEGTANDLDVVKISDLAAHPELKIGFSNEFLDREDGWPGLRRAYSLPQTEVQGLDHDLAYRGLQSGSIKLTDLYSTDAEIEYYGIRTLEDDRHYFPDYDAVLLIRNDCSDCSELLPALEGLEGAIDESAMIRMNAKAKLNSIPEVQVAHEFLKEQLGIETEIRIESRWQQLWGYTVSHLALVAMSLLPAIVVAIALGVLAAKVPMLEQPILSVVGIIQTIPALALLVIMIPILGIGAAPAVFALFLYSLLPIVRATHQGITGIPARLSESALAIGLPAKQRFFRIELPMAMPAIVSGIKVAAVINVGFATLGALIGAGGYGQPILTGIRLDDLGLILLGAIPSAVLALAVQWLFEFSERWLIPRGLRL